MRYEIILGTTEHYKLIICKLTVLLRIKIFIYTYHSHCIAVHGGKVFEYMDETHISCYSAATTPTFLRLTNIDTSLLPQRLCLHRSVITDAERLNPPGLSLRPRSPVHSTDLMDGGNQVHCFSGTEETHFCTRCTSSQPL